MPRPDGEVQMPQRQDVQGADVPKLVPGNDAPGPAQTGQQARQLTDDNKLELSV